jgi:hypothetical protein
VREDLESRLFRRDLNLFNQTLDIVFIDTTSLYVYRDSETEWRKRGYSRDHRPDLPQWVLCVAVNASGWPIAWEIFPGNTADQEALQKIVTALRSQEFIGLRPRAENGSLTQWALFTGKSSPNSIKNWPLLSRKVRSDFGQNRHFCAAMSIAKKAGSG